MLMIRLQRVGRVHEPTFRVVLVDSKRSTKSGQALEILGNHDTRKAKNNSNVDDDRIKYWISKGAQLSDTM
jgi:small subunit ribosomal protein S16